MTKAKYETDTVWDSTTELDEFDVAYAAMSYDEQEVSRWHDYFLDGVMSAALANHPRGQYLL